MFAFAGAAAGAFVFAGAGAFASALTFADVFAFASVTAGTVVCSAGASGFAFKTEPPPCKAGIEINSAEIIKTTAAVIVILARILVVPRGVNAVLEMLLVNSAPASVFPG